MSRGALNTLTHYIAGDRDKINRHLSSLIRVLLPGIKIKWDMGENKNMILAYISLMSDIKIYVIDICTEFQIQEFDEGFKRNLKALELWRWCNFKIDTRYS